MHAKLIVLALVAHNIILHNYEYIKVCSIIDLRSWVHMESTELNVLIYTCKAQYHDNTNRQHCEHAEEQHLKYIVWRLYIYLPR